MSLNEFLGDSGSSGYFCFAAQWDADWLVQPLDLGPTRWMRCLQRVGAASACSHDVCG